jgi:predicted Zn-dependent protease
MNNVRAKLLAGCGFAFVAFLISGCDLFRSADDRRARAEALLAQGAYNEAMVELKNVLSDTPSDARALLLVGRTNLQLGNFDAAAKAVESAEHAHADAAAVFDLRAQLLLYQGEHQQLLAMLDGNPTLAARNSALRAQALGGLDRCTEALPLARSLIIADAAEAAARIVLAECYARRGNRERALRELQTGVAAAPRNADLQMALGRLQQLLGMRTEAEKSWDASAQYAAGQLTLPQQAILYSALADLQIARNDAAALRKTHQRLLQLAPNSTITQLVGARALLMEGKANEAVAALRPIAIAAPALPATHAMLASAYITQENFEQARQEVAWIEQNAPNAQLRDAVKQGFDLSAQKVPDGEERWMHVAALQTALGQTEQARAALARAGSAAPSSPRPLLALARLELSAGNSAGASAIAADLAKKFPDDSRVQAVRADTLASSGDFAAANSVLGALRDKAESAPLAVALHRVRAAGKLPDANEPLISWLARNPRDPAVRGLLAESFRKAGDNVQAIEQYEALVSQRPNDAVGLNNLAWLYYQERDHRAVETAKRAWEIQSKNPAVADTYGWLLTEAGSVPEGVEILAKADALGGVAQPELRFHYVQALARNGNRAQAQALLKELMDESPEIPGKTETSKLLQSLAEPGAT